MSSAAAKESISSDKGCLPILKDACGLNASTAGTDPFVLTSAGEADSVSPGENDCSRPRSHSLLLRSGYAFDFNPSRIASGVMGMCRTRTPIAL